MKKMGKIRAATFLAAGVILLGAFWLDSHLSMERSQAELDGMYRRSLGDLTDHVTNMNLTLQKMKYTSSELTQSEVTAQLMEQSQGAKSAMAVLPFSQEKTERIGRFLSQVGDYALSMNRDALSGEEGPKQDTKTIEAMMTYAQKLSEALKGIQARLKVEKGSIAQTISILNNMEEMSGTSVLDDDIDQLAQEFMDFPTLLYDGPFSDHIAGRVPVSLTGLEGIDEQSAKQKAASYLATEENELSYVGEGGSQLPIYQFAGADSIAYITKQGGKLAYYKKSGVVNSAKLNYQSALESAKGHLAQWDFPDMRESYYVINDNLCTINFHSTSQTAWGQDVLCYPDLVKVTVELEKGGAVEMDSTGYLMNHHERHLKEPKCSMEDAADLINPLLTVEACSLAIIPTPGLDEHLCWELHCTTADAEEVISYINAETGQEEQLYLLQRDDHGVLAK